MAWQRSLRTRMRAAAGRSGLARVPLGREALCVALTSALLFPLVTRFLGQSYEIEGRCMEPRLRTGQRILGDKLTLRFRGPRRGEVVLFEHPRAPSQLYIKRVIALGGETVAIRGGVVYVNGRRLPEPYLRRPPRGDFPAHRVLEGGYFVLGDNRDVSDDSRYWGDVGRGAVVARAWLRQ